jgi:hypothetical protein
MTLKYTIERPIFRTQDRMNKPAVIAAKKRHTVTNLLLLNSVRDAAAHLNMNILS